MNAIILAAGKSSRLKLHNIQKCMISFGNDLAIDMLISRLPDIDELCVCIGTDFRAELLKNYLIDRYSKSFRVRFVVQDEPKGTANGVYLCLTDSNYDNVVISWSDVIPASKLPIPDESTIFTSDSGIMRFVSRYRIDDGIITPVTSNVGNIMGMFYIKDVQQLVPLLEHSEEDFVDVLQESGLVLDNLNIDFYDFGTTESLRVTSNNLSTSTHASIEIDGDKIIKTYKESDRNMFDNEVMWYTHADKSALRYMPKIHDIKDLTITMDKIDGYPFNNIIDEHRAKNFLAKAVFLLSEYFHHIKYPSDKESIKLEYINRTLERCKLVSTVVPGFSDNTININGTTYLNPLPLLKNKSLSEKICNTLVPETFTSIHGDATLQNMLQKDGEIWFIDPRGRFGNLWMFGDPKVDFAKLYFSLEGNYDGLNNGNYELVVDNGKFSYSVVRNRFVTLSEWYLDYLENNLGISKVHIKLLHAILWLRTVGYDFTKNVEQAIVSFLNGTVYFNEILEELE